MQSRTASSIKLGVVLILVVLIAVFGLTGSLRIGKYRFFPFADFLDPGLDLGGGVSATYAAADASADGLEEQLSQAEAVLRARLTALELPEANVTRLGDGLRVETPASADAEGDLSAIGAVGRLECQDSSGNVVLEGAAMTSPAVSTVYDDEGNPYPAVDFHPSDEAAQALSALSASETLNVYLDGELIERVPISHDRPARRHGPPARRVRRLPGGGVRGREGRRRRRPGLRARAPGQLLERRAGPRERARAPPATRRTSAWWAASSAARRLLRSWGAPCPSWTSSVPCRGPRTSTSRPTAFGKDHGGDFLMERLGLTPDEVCCFGDAENDLAVLRHYANSVAVANALPEVRAAADYHTVCQDESAIAHLIYEILPSI